MIAHMYLNGDYTIEEVIEQYNVSAAEVHAAIAYYYDNQAELDARHHQAIAWAEENAMTLDKFRAEIAARQDNNNK